MPTAATTPKPPLAAAYRALLLAWGPQRWWPARTRFEMMAGAVLTQNTAWTGASRAIRNLRAARALTAPRLLALPEPRLADLIRPAGTFRIKAARLHALARCVVDHGGLDRLFARPTPDLRALLLAIPGIGPETADCILLYAARRPVFVIDAYTRRMLARHGWLSPRASYDDAALLFTHTLPGDVPLFNEFHALLVELGKRHCRPAPRCEGCPLRRWLPARGGVRAPVPLAPRRFVA